MNQEGYIIELMSNKQAKIKTKRHSACASCGKCATTSESKDIIIEVDNSIGAKIGDRVEISMDQVKVMKATLIAYVAPLVALLAGTIIPFYVLGTMSIKENTEAISGVIGLICTVLIFLYIKKNDKKFRNSNDYVAKVTKIKKS